MALGRISPWGRMRQYHDPYSRLEPSVPRQFSADCIINMRGLNFPTVTGEIYERKLSSTSLGKCDNDPVEVVSQSGGGLYFHAEVFVACMKSKTSASWIFLAYETCSLSEKCSEKPPKNAPPRFIVTKDYWEPKPGPVRLQFEVLKYVKGFDCRVWSQRIRNAGAAPQRLNVYEAWICDRFDAYDGVGRDEDYKLSPSASKSFFLTDVGPTEPKPNPDETTVRNVAIPDDLYKLDWLKDVITSP